jgi:hypothetical protein
MVWVIVYLCEYKEHPLCKYNIGSDVESHTVSEMIDCAKEYFHTNYPALGVDEVTQWEYKYIVTHEGRWGCNPFGQLSRLLYTDAPLSTLVDPTDDKCEMVLVPKGWRRGLRVKWLAPFLFTLVRFFHRV